MEKILNLGNDFFAKEIIECLPLSSILILSKVSKKFREIVTEDSWGYYYIVMAREAHWLAMRYEDLSSILGFCIQSHDYQFIDMILMSKNFIGGSSCKQETACDVIVLLLRHGIDRFRMIHTMFAHRGLILRVDWMKVLADANANGYLLQLLSNAPSHGTIEQAVNVYVMTNRFNDAAREIAFKRLRIHDSSLKYLMAYGREEQVKEYIAMRNSCEQERLTKILFEQQQ